MRTFTQRLLASSVLVFLGLATVCTPRVLAQTFDPTAALKTATSGEGQARYAAIDQLGEYHEAANAVVPALIKLLDDPEPMVRWRAARSLGDFGTAAQAAAPELRALLKDKDPVVEYHAAVTLGKIGDESDATIDALVAAITSPDGRVARAAIMAVRNLHPDPERVMAVFDKVLASNDHAVVAHAIAVAVERGAKAVPALNAALKRPRTAFIACVAIQQIGPDAAGTVPALVDLLGRTKHSQLLIHDLLALAAIGPAAKSASPQIISLLDHKTDTTVPVAAAYALGSIGATDADADLERAMAKPNPMLQMVAAWALAKVHPDDAQLHKQAVDKLNEGLASDDPAIKAAAEKGLKSLAKPAAPAGE